MCPRLVAFREQSRTREPGWRNAPVPTFGCADARLLVVGLAPGLRGANRTGRPFTGDYAGDLLYPTLLDHGFATGTYGREADDGLSLRDCAITNAVRCVPPQNKPRPDEIRTCRSFLSALLQQMEALRVVVALGRVAHESLVRTWGRRVADMPFAHGRHHQLSETGASSLVLIDSYHCSRYNTSTRLLTETMFRQVIADARRVLDSGSA